MNRKIFLTMAAAIGLGVGSFALLFPSPLLASKGVSSVEANIWAREVGVLLIAIGVIAYLVRGHDDSPTLKAILLGNIIIQLGLLSIELLAYQDGIITLLSGIIPNTALHVVLAAGFTFYFMKMKLSESAGKLL